MPVGFRSGSLQDASRTDWDGAGPRPVPWAAWYPAADAAVETPMTAGGPQGTWFDLGSLARGAPPRPDGPGMPVVLVSHGTGGTAAGLGWLGRRLAERGFVVLGADHHGNMAAEPYRPEGFLCWWERARDLSILLDSMDREGFVAGHLDMERVFAAGFSLGCHTALSLLGAVTDMDRFRAWAGRAGRPAARGPREFPDLADRFPVLTERRAFRASWDRRAASYRDPRVRAALLLAPAPPVRAFTDGSLRGIDAPVHVMTGDADAEAPAEDGADWLAGRLARTGIQCVGADVGHYAFLPEGTEVGRHEAPDLCRDAPGVDRRAVHDAAGAAAEMLFRGDVRPR